jgi:hypothetical protein
MSSNELKRCQVGLDTFLMPPLATIRHSLKHEFSARGSSRGYDYDRPMPEPNKEAMQLLFQNLVIDIGETWRVEVDVVMGDDGYWSVGITRGGNIPRREINKLVRNSLLPGGIKTPPSKFKYLRGSKYEWEKREIGMPFPLPEGLKDSAIAIHAFANWAAARGLPECLTTRTLKDGTVMCMRMLKADRKRVRKDLFDKDKMEALK